MTAARPVPDGRSLRTWLREVHRSCGSPGAQPLDVIAAVVSAVARHHDVPSPVGPGVGRLPELPSAWCSPRLPGVVYEALAEPEERRARGSWFTPADVVDSLVGLTLADGFEPSRVLDPACGGGAFLLGVADALVRRGVAPRDAAGRLEGVDLDPGAAAVSRWSLDLWLALHGQSAGAGRITLEDSLTLDIEPADLVVGNPPFGTPLRSSRADSVTSTYRRGRPLLGPYADDAACFLDRASAQVRPGGRLTFVLPLSLLSARDTSGVVEGFGRWSLAALWVPGRRVFGANVHVFAPVLHRSPSRGEVVLYTGRSPEPAGTVAATSTWSAAAASALGVPAGPGAGRGTLAELVTATSGFRDQHYGLAGACREEADGPGGSPVVTVGQIDPLHWDRSRPVRLGGRHWDRPVVDVQQLPLPLATWVRRQLRPKILLATQSRVLEPLVDRTGSLVPSTPVIAVHTEADQLDRVAAVLLAPPVVAWAARRSIGSAMTPSAITLAARLVLEIPLPSDEGPWVEAASVLAGVDARQPPDRGLLEVVGALMCRAYDREDDGLWRWWHARLVATLPAGSGATASIER